MSTDLLVVVVLPTVLLSFITVATTPTTIATTATTVALLLTPIAASAKASGAFLQGATLQRTTCEGPRTCSCSGEHQQIAVVHTQRDCGPGRAA